MKNATLGVCLEINTALGFASLSLNIPQVLYFSYTSSGGALSGIPYIAFYLW